jgi:O-antigen ligase
MRKTRVTSERVVPADPGSSIPVLFFFFAAALIYGVFFMGVPISQARIEDRQHRDIFLLAIGALGLVAGLTFRRSGSRTREDRIITGCAIALPCYVLMQIVPMPVALVAVLSPSRAELIRALTPIIGRHEFASLSIVPAATFTHFLLLVSYCLIFFATWSFASRAREKAWVIASPVVVAAALEAILGLTQLFSGNGRTQVSGTYALRNHFAGLLEMALPFPAMYGVANLRQSTARGYAAAASAGGFAVAAGLFALILAGALLSLSRGGLAAIMISVLVMAAVATNWRMSLKRKLITAGVFCLLAMVALFYLTPMSLVARLAQHNTAGRLSVWSEGIALLAQYPLVGCGLGGFESAFLRYKKVEGLLLVDYAHNDYLQLFAELGAVGFLIGLALLGAIAKRVTGVTDDTSEIRWVAVACVGSLTAIAVHSAVDFNLYVAANAAMLAWVCGLATGLTPARRLSRSDPREGESAMGHGST